MYRTAPISLHTARHERPATGLHRLLAILGLLALAPGPLAAQPDDAFVPLFDGRSLDGWVVENSDGANFSVTGDVLRVEGPEGWLRSEDRYADYVLRVAFRFLTDDADSGVFVRAVADTDFVRGWPGNSYQVQTRDVSTNRSDNPLPIANLYRHRIADGETHYDRDAAFDAFRPTGEWQDFEIRVAADSIVVHLNGTPVTRAYDIVNPEGYIGLQGETGVVEYRSIMIKAL
jgi:hypothetical protein